MPDVLQDFPIAAAPNRVYEAIATPHGLNQWWTKTASGNPELGERYALGFGPEYTWEAVVTKAESARTFELELVKSDGDWDHTFVGFELAPTATGTQVRFHHRGWPAANEHYRVSCHCWAMYLRLLRRYLEAGEFVPYEHRLEV